jgi:hypothetical protein
MDQKTNPCRWDLFDQLENPDEIQMILDQIDLKYLDQKDLRSSSENEFLTHWTQTQNMAPRPP